MCIAAVLSGEVVLTALQYSPGQAPAGLGFRRIFRVLVLKIKAVFGSFRFTAEEGRLSSNWTENRVKPERYGGGPGVLLQAVRAEKAGPDRLKSGSDKRQFNKGDESGSGRV